MRHVAVASLLVAAGCASSGLQLLWADKPVVEFEHFQQPAPLMGPVDETALTCWRSRAEVDHRGFFVMRMSRGSYALRFCVATAQLTAAKARGQPVELTVRIDVSGEEDLVHAVQRMSPACSPPAKAQMTLQNVRVPESKVKIVPTGGVLRLDFDTPFGLFVEINTALEDEAVHLWEERRLSGSIVLRDPPLVTDRGRVRCLP